MTFSWTFQEWTLTGVPASVAAALKLDEESLKGSGPDCHSTAADLFHARWWARRNIHRVMRAHGLEPRGPPPVEFSSAPWGQLELGFDAGRETRESAPLSRT